MVHQHFMLVEEFTVLENVVLGAEGGFQLGAGLARARRALERLGRTYRLEVDPDARVADLGVGERQRVEILKALFPGRRPPDPRRADRRSHAAGGRPSLQILRALRGEGKSVLLATHKLREIAGRHRQSSP